MARATDKYLPEVRFTKPLQFLHRKRVSYPTLYILAGSMFQEVFAHILITKACSNDQRCAPILRKKKQNTRKHWSSSSELRNEFFGYQTSKSMWFFPLYILDSQPCLKINNRFFALLHHWCKTIFKLCKEWLLTRRKSPVETVQTAGPIWSTDDDSSNKWLYTWFLYMAAGMMNARNSSSHLVSKAL